jgi:hypothetical protein
MIVVKVELHSAITGRVLELARMHICNRGDSTNKNRGDYDVRTLRGRSKQNLDKGTVMKRGEVLNHARLQLHVWNLVAKGLRSMGYGNDGGA